MTYYILVKNYDGTEFKYFSPSATERDTVIKEHSNAEFMAWVASNGKRFKIVNLGELDRILPDKETLKIYDVYDYVLELRTKRDYLIKLLGGIDCDLLSCYLSAIDSALKSLCSFGTFKADLEEYHES